VTSSSSIARRFETHSARQDTVEAAWRVVDPILDDAVPVHPYRRGTWGPEEADALLPDNRTWHDPAG
jgi:glucose-6-phosphate 1-dehydrogenase